MPQLTPTIDLDHLVEQAIQAHRDELLELVRHRVAQTVDEFVAEVLAGLSSENGDGAEIHRPTDLKGDAPARTYTHVLVDRTEVDYRKLLA